MFLYKISISLFYFVIYSFRFFGNEKAKYYINGRKNIFNNSFINFSKINKPCIWIHCASMGEYQDASAFYQLCITHIKNHKFLITFSSPSGFEYYKDKNIADAVSYLPFEYYKSVSKFISHVNPQKVIFSRNDLWPALLKELNKKDVPVYLMDYYFSSKIMRLPFVKTFYTSVFKKINLVLCQDKKTETTLNEIFAVKNVLTTGNTRYDCQISESSLNDEFLELFTKQFTVIFGSVTEKDVFLCKHIYTTFKTRAKFIIVCHEPSLNFYNQFLDMTNGDIVKWSERKTSEINKKLLYVDSIGVLKNLYFSANVAYVGGGFTKMGIHNILEPAAAGNFILFGPNHRNYIEVDYLLNKGDARIVENSNEMASIVEYLIPQFKNSISNKRIVNEEKGASLKNFNIIFKDVL